VVLRARREGLRRGDAPNVSTDSCAVWGTKCCAGSTIDSCTDWITNAGTDGCTNCCADSITDRFPNIITDS
jgi:hypothetical protein